MQPLSAIILDQKGQPQPAFLPFWERFDLGMDDGRFEGVFDIDDDMPTRYEAAQRHTLTALRRYATENFTRAQIEGEALWFEPDSPFHGTTSKNLVDYNLALALSTPCHDLSVLVAYAETISDRRHVTQYGFSTLNKHLLVPYPELCCCLEPKTWQPFYLLTGYATSNFFRDVFERDDASMAKRLAEVVQLDRFQLDELFSAMPYLACSNLRNWHNTPKTITANEFYLRFEAQMSHFVDSDMTDDSGLLEWKDAIDENLDELPGYEVFVEEFAPDMAQKLFYALDTIDAALPAKMHRVHDLLMDEVSKHVDLRDYALRWFGKSPGWILTAKQQPDYDTFFLTTLLSLSNVQDDTAPSHAGALKGAQTTLRHFGYGKVAKLLRNQPELLLTAYKVTGHKPLIDLMRESDQATALGIDLGL